MACTPHNRILHYSPLTVLQVNKINNLEQEKRDLLESNTKLLEINVKQDTSLKAEKSMYSTLRFDVVASQTLSASVKDYVANLEKTISSSTCFLILRTNANVI